MFPTLFTAVWELFFFLLYSSLFLACKWCTVPCHHWQYHRELLQENFSSLYCWNLYFLICYQIVGHLELAISDFFFLVHLNTYQRFSSIFFMIEWIKKYIWRQILQNKTDMFFFTTQFNLLSMFDIGLIWKAYLIQSNLTEM